VPHGEPVTQTIELLANQTALSEVAGVQHLRLSERGSEHSSVEGDVGALGEPQQGRSVVATRPHHRVDVDEVTRVGTLVERAQLLRDRVVGVQDRSDRRPDRFVGARVHAQVDGRGLCAIGDGEPDERVVTAFCRHAQTRREVRIDDGPGRGVEVAPALHAVKRSMS